MITTDKVVKVLIIALLAFGCCIAIYRHENGKENQNICVDNDGGLQHRRGVDSVHVRP